MKWFILVLVSLLPVGADADTLGEKFSESRFKDYLKVELTTPVDYDLYVYHVSPAERDRFTSVKVNKTTGKIFELTFSGYKTIYEAVARASRICDGVVELPNTATKGSFTLKCVPGGGAG